MNDQTRTPKTACRCPQFCMLRMSVCVVSLLSLPTMVSMMLKVYLSLYTLLRSHLFVNFCIRRYSLYSSAVWSQPGVTFLRSPASFQSGVWPRLGHASVSASPRPASRSSSFTCAASAMRRFFTTLLDVDTYLANRQPQIDFA